MTRDRGEAGRISRRNLFTASVAAGAAALGAAGTADLWAPRDALAQTSITPDQALQRLMDGNARYVSGKLAAFDEDLSILRQRTVEKQEPFAAVLSCADSRLPAEIAFDQSIGHLFVCRVAGNIATPAVIGSLEYGTAVLGARLLMVLGHGACGAVTAAVHNKSVPGQISGLYPYIRPAVDKAGDDLTSAIKGNAVFQANLLRQASPVIAGFLKEGKLKVVAGYYDLATGKVSVISA